MNDVVTSKQKVAIAKADAPTIIPGRRDFFSYVDLGVEDASNGAMKAQIMRSDQGLTAPTGWHYHVCEQQFIYVIKGWVNLSFEDGRTIKLGEGDSMMIPGGTRHNETGTSTDLEILEVNTPASFGTVACDPPAGMSA
ncbi:MAG: cupin domain-containing protein [Gammaproteobacteria bacterium]|nr:cupin domain-containing protein [Gammaproteobacteria bacterium]